MKTLKKLMLNVVAISACLSPSIVLADYKSDIIDSCSAYQTGKDLSEVNACKLYIDGFIDVIQCFFEIFNLVIIIGDSDPTLV